MFRYNIIFKVDMLRGMYGVVRGQERTCIHLSPVQFDSLTWLRIMFYATVLLQAIL